jgi:hypothetical protein
MSGTVTRNNPFRSGSRQRRDPAKNICRGLLRSDMGFNIRSLIKTRLRRWILRRSLCKENRRAENPFSRPGSNAEMSVCRARGHPSASLLIRVRTARTIWLLINHPVEVATGVGRLCTAMVARRLRSRSGAATSSSARTAVSKIGREIGRMLAPLYHQRLWVSSVFQDQSGAEESNRRAADYV